MLHNIVIVIVTFVTIMCDITLFLFYQVQNKKRDRKKDRRIRVESKKDLNNEK